MVLKTVKLGVVGKIGSYLPDAALTPYPAYVQHVTPRPDKTRQASRPAMSAQFWNRAFREQKNPCHHPLHSLV
ncbi:hypothetical protein ACLBOM_07105 [Escherichia coli]